MIYKKSNNKIDRTLHYINFMFIERSIYFCTKKINNYNSLIRQIRTTKI